MFDAYTKGVFALSLALFCTACSSQSTTYQNPMKDPKIAAQHEAYAAYKESETHMDRYTDDTFLKPIVPDLTPAPPNTPRVDTPRNLWIVLDGTDVTLYSRLRRHTSKTRTLQNTESLRETLQSALQKELQSAKLLGSFHNAPNPLSVSLAVTPETPTSSVHEVISLLHTSPLNDTHPIAGIHILYQHDPYDFHGFKLDPSLAASFRDASPQERDALINNVYMDASKRCAPFKEILPYIPRTAENTPEQDKVPPRLIFQGMSLSIQSCGYPAESRTWITAHLLKFAPTHHVTSTYFPFPKRDTPLSTTPLFSLLNRAQQPWKSVALDVLRAYPTTP